MKYSNFRLLTSARFAFSILVLVVLSPTLRAQTSEVQIMVAGPWDYVQDPNDATRIILLAPVAKHHRDAEVFSGPDAPEFRLHFPESIATGLYRIDICNAAHVGCYTYSGTPTCDKCYPYRLQETANQTIPLSDIQSLISASKERYAISLPKPYAYSTFCGSSLDCSGLSQAIISTQKINDPSPKTETRQKDYTTWMVLRYKMSGTSLAWLTGTSDARTAYEIPKAFTSESGTPAISIVLAPTDNQNTLHCDKYSSESFQDSIGKWKLNLYSLLPNLKPGGIDQDRDHFDYRCKQRPTLSDDMGDSYTDTVNDLLMFDDYFGRSSDLSKEQAQKSLDQAKASVMSLFNESTDQAELKKLENDFQDLGQLLAKDNQRQSLSEKGKRELADIFIQLDLMMAGATDCRKAQFSINGAIPPLAGC